MDQNNNQENKVIVAIDNNKGSQYALKWAIEHVLNRFQHVTLIHVKSKPFANSSPNGNTTAVSNSNQDIDSPTSNVLLPFRCFCTRKDIKCEEVILEDTDISKAIIEYTKLNAFTTLVLGASTRIGLVRKFKGSDVPATVFKGAPDFTTVYIIHKRKILSVKQASYSPTACNPYCSLPRQILFAPLQTRNFSFTDNSNNPKSSPQGDWSIESLQKKRDGDDDQFRSPFTRGEAANGRLYGQLSMPECDISFVGSSVPTSNYIYSYDSIDFGQCPRFSVGLESTDGMSFGSNTSDTILSTELSSSNSRYSSQNSSICSGFSSNSMEEVESEMRRLRQELKQTMDMYNAATKEALIAKQKANDLQVSQMEGDKQLEEALIAEEAALAIVDKEKKRSKMAMEAAEASKRIAQMEAQKRKNAELKALRECEDMKKTMDAISNNEVNCRKYSFEDIEVATDNFADSLKIGEGGYGPVYQCTLDHTPVAVKLLRLDVAQGRSQFKQEVEILSRIRHPNMVILLGACPDHGCLIYEYMPNGSLEDRLFCKGNTPALPWQFRFRIAAEIATALLFMHQTKPQPLVHRDLKPGNILLDQNYTSKISDVGLARLVPPAVADSVTQYRMTQTAGTLCYIDPEYQLTGKLGVKSDIYSLGILFLQMVTGRSPMGLTHHVQRAIQKGNLANLLDPEVDDWPVEEAVAFAKLALQCAELRRKDRPDLANHILPELNRLRAFGDEMLLNIN